MGLVWRTGSLADPSQIDFVLFMRAVCTEYKRNVFSYEYDKVSMWEIEWFWHAGNHVGCSLHDGVTGIGILDLKTVWWWVHDDISKQMWIGTTLFRGVAIVSQKKGSKFSVSLDTPELDTF